MDEEFILIEGAAGDGKQQPKVMGLAYSGGKMSLPGWRQPVVVDLAGMSMPDRVPLLANHENRTTSRIGMVAGRIENGGLVIEGEILASGGEADAILEQAKAGGDWQLSIGAEVEDAELVVKGRSRSVNSQMHEGPFYHVKKSVLREVSVVAVGADQSTRMKVAAMFNLIGGNEMDSEKDTVGTLEVEANGQNAPVEPEKKPEVPQEPEVAPKPDPESGATAEQIKAQAAEAVKVERERIAEIQGICDGEFPKIEREAISAGWSPDRVRTVVLKAMRDNRPQADVAISVAPERTPERSLRRLEAALCFRAGISEDTLLATYGEEVLEDAYPDRNLSLHTLFAECAKAEGLTVPRNFDNDSIRAGFSTVSLPGILNNVTNKRLMKVFQAQPIIATRLCSEGELTDFKESERYRLTDVGDLEPISPDGELRHGGVTEEKATNQLKTYGKTFTLTREMIYNDDLSTFLRVPEGMGARAARKIDQLFFKRLLSNPNNLFSEAHRNYKAGTATALSPDSLAQAMQMFMDQVDADGQPINVEPRFLLVPSDLKMTAKEIIHSSFLMSVGSSNKQRIPTYNPLADENLEIVTSPYLSNSNYPGASKTGWYLFSDPSVLDTWEIAYLRGKKTPTVERGETDFDTLGLRFRVFCDVACRGEEYRGERMFNGVEVESDG